TAPLRMTLHRFVRPVLFDEFGLLVVRPRVVVERKADARWDIRVIVENEDENGIGSGVAEVDFAKDLEGLRGGLAGVRSQAMGDLKAVLISLMFLMTAESAGDGSGQREEYGENEN